MAKHNRREFFKRAGIGIAGAFLAETVSGQTKGKGAPKQSAFQRPEMTEAELKRGPIYQDAMETTIVNGRGYSPHRFQTPIYGPNVVIIDTALERHRDGSLGFVPQPALANVQVPPPANQPMARPMTYSELLTDTAIGKICKERKINIALVLTDDHPNDGKAPFHPGPIGKLTGAKVVGMFVPGTKGPIMSEEVFNDIDRRSQTGDPFNPGKEFDEKVKAGKDNLGYFTWYYQKPGADEWVKGPRWQFQLATNPAIFDAKKAGLDPEAGLSDDQKLLLVHIIDGATNLSPGVKNAMLAAHPDGVKLAQQPGAADKQKRGRVISPEDLIPELRNAPPPKGVDGGLPKIEIPKPGRAGVNLNELRRPPNQLGGGDGNFFQV